MKDKKIFITLTVSILILILGYLLIPPEFTVKYGKLHPYKKIIKVSLDSSTQELDYDNVKNIFGIKKIKKIIKPPNNVKINIVKTIKKEPVVTQRNLKFTYLGYHTETNPPKETVFIYDGKTIHFLNKGDVFLERYKLDDISTKSVILFDNFKRRKEEVRVKN